MGVYIPNIEMPRNCTECLEFGDYCDTYADYYCSHETRPIDCPLIEIPTPHGRLIDGDAVIKKYYKNPTYPNLCMALNNAPTIIEAEE